MTVFFLGFFSVKDTDFGWHYQCGNQFLTTGKLCLTNEFSYFLPYYKAYYTGHLYDIILAFAYNHGGLLTVSALGGVVFVLSALFFVFLIQAGLPIKIGAFLSAFFLSYSIFDIGLRPQIISYLFFLVFLSILSQKNEKLFFLIPVLMVIWVNMHIGFFVGLFILMFYLFEKKTISSKKYFFIVLLSFAATLLNPFGTYVYKEIVNHITSPLNTMIAEWLEPPLPHIILIAGLSIIGLILLIRKKSISLFKIFILVFFSILSLKARRNLPFFYTSFAFVFFDGLKINTEKFSSLFVSLLIALFIIVGVIQVPQTIHHSTSWEEYCNKTITVAYPCEAVRKFPQLSGNVFALYEWGGFLIWEKPDIKIFADGRMPAWKDEKGKSPYQVYLDIIQTKNGWNEKLNSLKTDYIFITNKTFLDLLLKKGAEKYRWREVYRDNLAVIYQNAI